MEPLVHIYISYIEELENLTNDFVCIKTLNRFNYKFLTSFICFVQSVRFLFQTNNFLVFLKIKKNYLRAN